MAIITISRGVFSGGEELAEAVAKKLGYRCISTEVLHETAKDFGVPVEKLSKALSQKPGIIERLTSEKRHYVEFIRDELINAARKEKIIYHGLAGHLLLRRLPHVLRVKVIAGMEFRIKAAVERNEFNREEALKYIEKMDHERDQWVRWLYHVDRDDPATYDVVINLEKIKMTSAIEMLRTLAKQEEFQPNEASQKRMNDLILAADLRTEIAAHTHVADGKLEISAEDGVVTLGGTVDNLIDADEVKEVTRKFPGVKGVKPQMHVIAALIDERTDG
jgi:cytidylate kinase